MDAQSFFLLRVGFLGLVLSALFKRVICWWSTYILTFMIFCYSFLNLFSKLVCSCHGWHLSLQGKCKTACSKARRSQGSIQGWGHPCSLPCWWHPKGTRAFCCAKQSFAWLICISLDVFFWCYLLTDISCDHFYFFSNVFQKSSFPDTPTPTSFWTLHYKESEINGRTKEIQIYSLQDGPSAGVAVLLALASLVLNRHSWHVATEKKLPVWGFSISGWDFQRNAFVGWDLLSRTCWAASNAQTIWILEAVFPETTGFLNDWDRWRMEFWDSNHSVACYFWILSNNMIKTENSITYIIVYI